MLSSPKCYFGLVQCPLMALFQRVNLSALKVRLMQLSWACPPSPHPAKLPVTHGSLFSGNINHKVVPLSPLLDPAHCSQSSEWSVGFPGAVCDHAVDFHRLSFNNPSPSSLRGKDVILTNSYGIKIHTLKTFKCQFVVQEAGTCLCPRSPSTGD